MKDKEQIKKITAELDQAIDAGDMDRADELTEELLRRKGLGMPQVQSPDNLIESFHTVKRLKSRRKIGIALVAVMIAILSIGTISYAAGILFPETVNKDGSKAQINAALDCKEYKAAQEYLRYLDRLSEGEQAKVIDTSEGAIYDAPEEVKKIAKKYELNYATKRTDPSSYKAIEKELSRKGLANLLDSDLKQALKETMEEVAGGYWFDDGNLHLEMGINKENAILSINITPIGSFPWMGFSPNEGLRDEGQGTYTLQSKDEVLFTCIGDKDYARAFAKTSDYFITIGLTKTSSEETDKELATLRKNLDQKIRKQTDMKSYEAMFEKFCAASEKMINEEPEKAEKAINGDRQLHKRLIMKYSGMTEKELEVYEECNRALDDFEKKQAEERIVTRADLSQYLNKLNF